MDFPLPDPNKPLDQQTPLVLLTSIIVAEAANQIDLAKFGVACVIRNRWQRRIGFGSTWTAVLLQRNAFSVTIPGSSGYAKLLQPLAYETPATWQKCYAIAASVYYGVDLPDPTNGAHFYFSPPITRPPQDWGQVTFAAKIDQLSFYRQAPPAQTKAA